MILENDLSVARHSSRTGILYYPRLHFVPINWHTAETKDSMHYHNRNKKSHQAIILMQPSVYIKVNDAFEKKKRGEL